MMRANLWLRAASRVVVRVAHFRATAFFELEKRAKKIPWDSFVAPGAGAEFRVTARKSRLYHTEAIAERLRTAASRAPRTAAQPRTRAKGAGPRTASSGEQLFIVRVLHDEFMISADTSGELLHMRGYRQAVAKAPLRETLAAALLLGVGWDGGTPLVDPFCGSGTIPIEAALIARRIAPGVRREFAFMRWPNFDGAVWRDLTTSAQAAALASSPVPIAGSDRDAGAVDAARANAERAGVGADVDFSVRAISDAQTPSSAGLVATNPPYGVRVSEGRDLRNLYARFGRVLRERCRGWSVALYAPDVRLARETGLSLRSEFRTSNGGIKVAALIGSVPG